METNVSNTSGLLAEPITLQHVIVAIAVLISLANYGYLAFKKWSETQKVSENEETEDVEKGLLPTIKEGEELVVKEPPKESVKPKPPPESAALVISRNFSFMGLILLYFFICDRTTLLHKADKSFNIWHFAVPLLVLLILGIAYNKTSKQTAILHRDQTDEWKGWMQLVILVYHITGASKIIPIYMQIRCLVSAYLFMSGFGHFYFYYTKGDYSIHRVLSVLFRLNFLTVLLCLVMSRPYMLYYFVPLISFWFIIMYATMACWPRVTLQSSEENRMHYLFMLLKLIGLFVILSICYYHQEIFEVVFGNPLLSPFFVMKDGTVHEWYFRYKIDRYSTFYGMAFTFCIIVVKKKGYMNDQSDMNLFSNVGNIMTVASCLAGYVGYTVYTINCTEKETCNSFHAWMAFLPIISFVMLRNVVGKLRQKYSSFFAWFGKISLELFISQYHIWLATDTRQVLMPIPSMPPLSLVLTTLVFVAISLQISHITGAVQPHLVPKDTQPLVRNVIIAGAIGVLMWIGPVPI